MKIDRPYYIDENDFPNISWGIGNFPYKNEI